jgi:preprotein translocase subunit YajC
VASAIHAEATEIMESLGGLLFPLLILLVFVPIFLSGRKQRRQMVEMQQLQSALQVGDVVTTTSGLRGTVVDASYEETVDLEIADDVVTTWLRAAVREKVADGSTAVADAEPAPDAATTPVTGASLDGPDGRTPAGAHTDVVADPADTPSDANGSARP